MSGPKPHEINTSDPALQQFADDLFDETDQIKESLRVEIRAEFRAELADLRQRLEELGGRPFHKICEYCQGELTSTHCCGAMARARDEKEARGVIKC
jgi:hypothetical protein